MKKLIMALLFISTFSLLQGCAAGIADGRTMTEQFDDNALSRAALHKIQELNISNTELRINFLTNSGYLLVVGEVSSQAYLTAIETKLASLKEAKGVYNQLRIGRPIGFAQQSKDSWITTQIKAKFTTNDYIDPFQIKVVTENSEVFLVGKITKEMANVATNIARNVEGVKLVNRAFQIADE
ncbi:BON domain-containing protein [Psychromonas sp. PT13]|uniref:BON domain-containing protein n=1 Tax=Psychromonas sp. PT13 TaxID=3439547 RepID=UPI003EB6B093